MPPKLNPNQTKRQGVTKPKKPVVPSQALLTAATQILPSLNIIKGNAGIKASRQYKKKPSKTLLNNTIQTVIPMDHSGETKQKTSPVFLVNAENKTKTQPIIDDGTQKLGASNEMPMRKAQVNSSRVMPRQKVGTQIPTAVNRPTPTIIKALSAVSNLGSEFNFAEQGAYKPNDFDMLLAGSIQPRLLHVSDPFSRKAQEAAASKLKSSVKVRPSSIFDTLLAGSVQPGPSKLFDPSNRKAHAAAASNLKTPVKARPSTIYDTLLAGSVQPGPSKLFDPSNNKAQEAAVPNLKPPVKARPSTIYDNLLAGSVQPGPSYMFEQSNNKAREAAASKLKPPVKVRPSTIFDNLLADSVQPGPANMFDPSNNKAQEGAPSTFKPPVKVRPSTIYDTLLAGSAQAGPSKISDSSISKAQETAASHFKLPAKVRPTPAFDNLLAGSVQAEPSNVSNPSSSKEAAASNLKPAVKTTQEDTINSESLNIFSAMILDLNELNLPKDGPFNFDITVEEIKEYLAFK